MIHIIKVLVKALAVLAIVGVLALGTLLGGLWFERRAETTLPVPSGPFAVGRTADVWSDETPDTRAPIPGAKRELFAWIWYPTAAPSSAPIGDYVPAQWRTAAAGRRFTLMGLLTKDAARVHGHSFRNADVSLQQRSYPVVLLRGGAASSVLNYSTLAEDLASHGYIVVGIDAPYRTGVVVFPDGRVARETPENNGELCAERNSEERVTCIQPLFAAWISDMKFVVDRLEQLNTSDPSGKFTGRIDLSRIGAFGHSFGGAQAAQFCHDDPRCKAAVDIDGRPFGSVIQEGMRKPLMFVLSGDIQGRDPETTRIKADIQSIYDRLPPDSRWRIAIRGAFHFMFSDDGAVLKSRVLRAALRLFGKLGIDARRQLQVTAYCVRGFFDTYLKGAGPSALKTSLAQYPEVELLG